MIHALLYNMRNKGRKNMSVCTEQINDIGYWMRKALQIRFLITD